MSRTAARRGGGRPLTLHVSALSDAEYASFTGALGELAGPATAAADGGGVNWGDVTLGVREARGWIRGRYGAGVDGAAIDQVCCCSSSSCLQTGGCSPLLSCANAVVLVF